MKFLNVVGPQIRKLRYGRGWSQSELAVRLQLAGWDISRSGLAKIESKLVWVGDFELFYLMKVFQVGAEALLPKIDSQKPTHEALLLLLQKNRTSHADVIQTAKRKASAQSLASTNCDSRQPPRKNEPLKAKTPTGKPPIPYIPTNPMRTRQQAARSAV